MKSEGLSPDLLRASSWIGFWSIVGLAIYIATIVLCRNASSTLKVAGIILYYVETFAGTWFCFWLDRRMESLDATRTKGARWNPAVWYPLNLVIALGLHRLLFW